MNATTLGLDIGPTSVGWALIDESADGLIAVGARVFPEGVDRDQQGGEKSKTQDRRTARGMRRQLARRARRKRQIRDLLVQQSLLPANAEEFESVLLLNPYALRARALDERLEPFEVGRVLVHLGQRRGFLSNRKTDKARSSDTKGMLKEIGALDEAIRESGCRTLGEYLATRVQASFDHRTTPDDQRVRHRHTRRDMYEREFNAIWEKQAEFHADRLTSELKQQVHRIIFFQRKMYWPKSVVGRCELEPKLKRCPKADRAAQRFRMLQEVNNIRVMDSAARLERTLSPAERTTIIEYLSGSKERSFDDLRRKLKWPESMRFNYERAERTKLKGMETESSLKATKALGKRWGDLDEETRDAIVKILVEEEHEDVALSRLTTECALSPEEAERALGVNLPDGYMSYSRQAIDRLLPHLERGLLLMADDATNSALHAAGYLRPDEREVRQRRFLPPSPDLPNPIVRQALIEVRKVVNAVIREYGRPDRIHVELAREAKKSIGEREEIRFENAKNRKRREIAADEIEEHGAKPTRASINRFLLWQEQGENCVYCGDKISQAQLFNGETDVDHILPRWRSLDDSMANKVVCHRKCNAEKGDRTPREWLEAGDPERYERVLRCADMLPSYGKRRKFLERDILLDDFVNRQFQDTAYIARLVSQYLRCLGAEIVTPRGQMTADLRHYWGLNAILDTEGRGEKNRADNRHHTIDAIVIALTDRKRLHAVANSKGKEVQPPWERFREDVARVIGQVNVSHRVRRRLHGALHEDTLYGATDKRAFVANPKPRVARRWSKLWVEEPGTYVRRKDITTLNNTKQLEKVRDFAIREILLKHLRDRGVDAAKPGKIPTDAFKGQNTPRMPSGVPIKRIRMLEESETFRPASTQSQRRAFHFVKPGNNHHIVYRATGEGENEKWTGEVVTMWDATARARAGLALVDRSDNDEGRFVMSLSINEIFQIDGENGQRLLCVVRKMTQPNRRLYYKVHTDARPAGEVEKDGQSLFPSGMQRRHARKLTVDPLGRIRWAND